MDRAIIGLSFPATQAIRMNGVIDLGQAETLEKRRANLIFERSNAEAQRGLFYAERLDHIIEDWRADYNANRPHTSLGGLMPDEFAQGRKGPDAE